MPSPDADSADRPLPTPRAILFDLDDTLLDTTDSATRVWHNTARAFEEEIGLPAAQFDPVLDASRKWYWADPHRNRRGRLDVHRSRVEVTLHGLHELNLPGRTDLQLANLAERFSRHYSDHRVESMRFFPGAQEALEHFHDRGVRMALLTNGDAEAQRQKVEHFALDRFFQAVLIEGELGFGKPDPRVFQKALDACGVEAKDAWCVGDNLGWEVAAPQQLGMTGVWVDWNSVGLPEDSEIVPDLVVRRVAELPVMLDTNHV